MVVGIDKIGFATGRYSLNLKELALARNVDPAKFEFGLMLNKMSIPPVSEDIVTLAASAAQDILTKEDKESIDMVIMATESGIDQSKAASIFVHGLLKLSPFVRTLEMKQACYSATAALDYAKRHVEKFPDRKVLVLASDIARYGIRSGGEPTQGSGALALLISANPRLMAFNDDNVYMTKDIMDFWRPNYSTTPYVQGALSTQNYLECLEQTWAEHQRRYGTTLSDLDAICFHVPFPKQALKGLEALLATTSLTEEKTQQLRDNFTHSIAYGRQVGNIYTGSLYLSLLSLLDNSRAVTAGSQIGFYSYGSGSVSEVFTGTLVQGFESQLPANVQERLEQRQPLSVKDYENIFYESSDVDEGGNAQFGNYLTNGFALTEILDHQRIYSEVADHD